MILEPQSIIDEIRKRGMELVTAGDMVRFRPQSAMTPELFQLLKLNKAGVLEILSNQNPTTLHPLADFDFTTFGDPPPWIQHKDRGKLLATPLWRLLLYRVLAVH